MPGTTLEDLQRKYPPANREEYDRARAAAKLAGDVAELVYAMRTRAELTQTQLAARMGTTQSSIARMESGGSLPTIEMLARLAHATGVPVHLEAPGVADVEILTVRKRARRASTPRRSSRVPADLVGARQEADSRSERQRA
jgi:transcriptional regulator with XRE-family HTH domain